MNTHDSIERPPPDRGPRQGSPATEISRLRESEARFRTIFEGAAIGIILEDLDGQFLETNPAVQNMLGYTADELRGMHYKTVTYPDDIGLKEEIYLDMVAGKRDQFQVEKRYTRKDGRVVWARTTVSLGRGPTGEPEFAIAMIEDITERKRAEDAIHFLAGASGIMASSLDYRTTLTNLAELSVPTLADWCVVDVVEDRNIYRLAAAHVDPVKQGALREFQRRYPPDWESRQPSAEALRTGKAVLLPNITEAVLDDRTSGPEHKQLLRALGIKSVIAVPLVARGHTLGAISLISAARRYDPDDLAFAEDLGRRAAVAIDNARLYEAALAASKAKSDFLAVMSHELRTPLSAVTGYADLLDAEVTGPVTEKQRAQLRLIKLRAQDLLRIIEEVLTFSRMEAGRARVRLEHVDLSWLVREVLAVARPLAEEKGLDLHVRLPDEPIEIETDQAKVHHILLDLLSNAVKFTERGEIELRAGVEKRTLFFRVRDTGIGIRPEYHEKIFQPFFQLEEALTRETGGTGLGLAVARRLARLLGGDITLKSTLGEGSEFILRLPAPAEDQPEPPREG